MLQIDPSLQLLAINNTTVRKVSADWQDALRIVRGFATDNPGASVVQATEVAARILSSTDQVMTLGDAAVEALINSKPAQECDGAAKLKRWKLARQFADGAPFELDIADASFVQDALAEFWKASIYGAAYEALNRTGPHAPKPAPTPTPTPATAPEADVLPDDSKDGPSVNTSPRDTTHSAKGLSRRKRRGAGSKGESLGLAWPDTSELGEPTPESET